MFAEEETEIAFPLDDFRRRFSKFDLAVASLVGRRRVAVPADAWEEEEL